MKNKLPVYIEDNELPKIDVHKNDNSYGYVSILYLSSIIITSMTNIKVFLLVDIIN